MMSMDQELLSEYYEQLASRFYGYEIVERLEDAGIITVEQLIAAIEDYILEGRAVLDE